MSRPPLRLLVVVAALAAGVLADPVLEDAPSSRPAAEVVPEVAVVGAAAVCPDLRQDPGLVTTVVSAGAPAAGGTDGTDGTNGTRAPAADAAAAPAAPGVTVRPLAAEPAAATPLSAEAPVSSDLGADLGLGAGAALEVRASGEAAAGLAVQQATLVTTDSVRGLAALRCGPARTDSWLLGGGTTVGEVSTLLLANPDPEPAVVDVTVLTGEGSVDERPGRGLTVPPGGRVEVPLDTLAPDRLRLAVRVQASRGRVAAALRHERTDGVTPRGVAYAARADGPAPSVELPGLPAGPGGRAVWVANPSDVDLEVALEVTTLDGQFVPDGLDAVAVPSGSTAAVDLSEVLGPTPATVRVTSAGAPVLAVGLAEDAGEDDVRDFAYTGPAPALSGSGLLTDVVLGAAEHTLLLSALSGDAVVELSLVPVVGAPVLPAPARRVDVPGGRTVAVPLSSLVPEGSAGRVAVQVTPDRRSSPVHAGLVVSARPAEGPLLTAFPVTAAAVLVPQPVVVRDPAVGAGSR